MDTQKLTQVVYTVNQEFFVSRKFSSTKEITKIKHDHFAMWYAHSHVQQMTKISQKQRRKFCHLKIFSIYGIRVLHM